MQNDIESKIHAANSNSIRDKDEITQLKHELFAKRKNVGGSKMICLSYPSHR